MILHIRNTESGQRAARYYFFMKWFKRAHNILFNQYAMHINLPEAGMTISVSLDYIQPEDKEEILKIIDGYNGTHTD